MARTVIFSIFGVNLDSARGPERWERWRPTLSLCQHDDFLPDRIELIHEPAHAKGAAELAADIESASPETTVVLNSVHWRDPWDFADVYETLAQLADGYAFNEDDERYLVHMTTGTHVAQICLFLLAESRRLPAALIQSSPPGGTRARGRSRANGRYSIIDLDLSRYDALATRFDTERQSATSLLKAGIETKSATFNALIERIEVVASSSTAPILLTGATGVGKTALARRIFELKREKHLVPGAFVEVNCATIRGDGAMSALFGHERGAFTGAATRRGGLLAQADGGLLFLDEVGELGLDEQAMLLRAIEEGVFLPLGSDRARSSQFQLIAGTNRDLYTAVAEGRFREDLLARIDLWHFELPRLRDRLEDLEANLDFELKRQTERSGRRFTFNRQARGLFLDFAKSPGAAWSGNFRDFSSAVERLVTLAARGRVTADLVHEETARLDAHWQRLESPSGSAACLVERFLSHEQTAELDTFDRVQLEEVLRVCLRSPTLSAAGRHLFEKSRLRKASRNDSDRLKKYLARFELDWATLAASS